MTEGDVAIYADPLRGSDGPVGRFTHASDCVSKDRQIDRVLWDVEPALGVGRVAKQVFI